MPNEEPPPGWTHNEMMELELVEISLGHTRNNTTHMHGPEEGHLKEGPDTGERYEYYHVLWIERVGVIAYRKGLGRIAKDHWEAQEREWMDLIRA